MPSRPDSPAAPLFTLALTRCRAGDDFDDEEDDEEEDDDEGAGDEDDEDSDDEEEEQETWYVGPIGRFRQGLSFA